MSHVLYNGVVHRLMLLSEPAYSVFAIQLLQAAAVRFRSVTSHAQAGFPGTSVEDLSRPVDELVALLNDLSVYQHT